MTGTSSGLVWSRYSDFTPDSAVFSVADSQPDLSARAQTPSRISGSGDCKLIPIFVLNKIDDSGFSRKLAGKKA